MAHQDLDITNCHYRPLYQAGQVLLIFLATNIKPANIEPCKFLETGKPPGVWETSSNVGEESSQQDRNCRGTDFHCKVSHVFEVLEQVIKSWNFTFSVSVHTSGCWKAPGKISNTSITMNTEVCYWIIYQCEDTAQWITIIKEDWTWIIFNYGWGLEINLILPALPERWMHSSRFARKTCPKMW